MDHWKDLGNPWENAWIIIRKNEKKKAAEILKKYLQYPSNTEEFRYGLEFAKAIKSLWNPFDADEVFREAFSASLYEKLLNDFEPTRIIERMSNDYTFSMGTLALLEVLLGLGRDERPLILLENLITHAPKKLSEDNLREFARALIYGPLTRLKPDALAKLLKKIREMEISPTTAQLRAEFLSMILGTYPPTHFKNSPQLRDEIAAELSSLSSYVLKNYENSPEEMETLYWELSNVLSRITGVCRDIGDWGVCNDIIRKTGDSLARMFDKLGKAMARKRSGIYWREMETK